VVGHTGATRFSAATLISLHLDAIHTHLQSLKGYEVKRRNDTEDLLRRSREGV